MVECRQLRDRTVTLRETIDGLKAQRFGGTPGGTAGKPSQLDATLDQLNGIEAQWNKSAKEMVDALSEIDSVIGSLPDSKWRTLLRLRYMDGFSWERVAKAMCYSKQHVFEIHNEALDAVRLRVENERSE